MCIENPTKERVQENTLISFIILYVIWLKAHDQDC